MCDAQGRPYFLWDDAITLSEFLAKLRDPDPNVAAYWLGKAMRQSKPDDILQFTTTDEIRAAWPRLERYLGRDRAMWAWLLEAWAKRGK